MYVRQHFIDDEINSHLLRSSGILMYCERSYWIKYLEFISLSVPIWTLNVQNSPNVLFLNIYSWTLSVEFVLCFVPYCSSFTLSFWVLLMFCSLCFQWELEFRVLLTGTPVQNNLQELYSLLSFVAPRNFRLSGQEKFVKKYQDVTNNKGNDNHRLDKSLRSYMFFLLSHASINLVQIMGHQKVFDLVAIQYNILYLQSVS